MFKVLGLSLSLLVDENVDQGSLWWNGNSCTFIRVEHFNWAVSLINLNYLIQENFSWNVLFLNHMVFCYFCCAIVHCLSIRISDFVFCSPWQDFNWEEWFRCCSPLKLFLPPWFSGNFHESWLPPVFGSMTPRLGKTIQKLFWYFVFSYING